jgi:serine/threonine protein kinase
MSEDRSDCQDTRHVDAVQPEDPLVGKLIDGRYMLHECLGEGGMGFVYRATHVMMDKPVAVKVIQNELAHIPEVVKRFEREARSASRLTDPHCISVTDFGRTEEGMLYLVMELLKGEELADRLLKAGALPVKAALDLTKQILKGLVHAHEAGVIHRDLKPENVMLVVHGDETDFAKVFDFGIAKLASGAGSQDNLTQAGMVVGTPSYLSPEQALGEEADHRADIYAVGIMLYEMLAGVRPFTGDSAMDIVTAHLTTPVPPLPEPSRFPPGLQKIIERALAKKPGERFGSASEFLDALEAIDPEAIPVRVPAVTLLAQELQKLTSPIGIGMKSLKRIDSSFKAALAGFKKLDAKKRRLAVMLGAASTVLLVVAITASVGTEDRTFQETASVRVVDDPEIDANRLKAMFDRADEQIRAGLAGEAVITVKEALRLSSEQPIGHLLLGHALFLSGERAEAMKSYRRALSMEKELAGDVRLGEHLKEGLEKSPTRTAAAKLLVEFGGEKGIDWLSSRASSALSDGEERRVARQALIAAKREDAVDWVTSLTADFNEYKSCKMRRKIIAEMEETKNPEFLPLLKASLASLKKETPKKKGLIGQIKESFRKNKGGDKTVQCIEADLKRAIQTLTAVKDGKEKAS